MTSSSQEAKKIIESGRNENLTAEQKGKLIDEMTYFLFDEKKILLKEYLLKEEIFLLL